MPTVEKDQVYRILGSDLSKQSLLIINTIYHVCHRSIEDFGDVVIAGKRRNLSSSAHVGQRRLETVGDSFLDLSQSDTVDLAS